jgi:hypothetical protein
MNNVVLTACTDYSYANIAYFVESFQKYVSDSDLVIIGGRLSVDTLETLRDRNVKFVDVHQEYLPVNRLSLKVLQRFKVTPGARKYYPLMFKLFSMATKNPEGYEYSLQGIQSFRYRHYKEYLEQNNQVENVALLDIRDVVFQSDVFSMPCNTLEFGLEEGITVEPDSFNFRWLATVAGVDNAKSYIGREVSCSGATFGPRKPMIDYLKMMDRLLTNKFYPLGPTDQGAHNYIRYEQKVKGIEDVPNRTRRVQNMQGQTSWERNGKYIVDSSTNITPVIHQWDRHSDLCLWPNEMLS